MVQSVIGEPQPQQQSQPNLHGTFDSLEHFNDPAWLTQNETELAALTAQQSPLPPLNTRHMPRYSQNGNGQPYEQQHLHPELRSPHSDTQSTPVQPTTGYRTDVTSLRRWSPSFEHLSTSPFASSNGIQYESLLPPPASMLEHGNTNGDRLELNYVLEPKHHSASTSPSSLVPPTYPLSSAPDKPIYARLPSNTGSSCPLDSLLLDFLKDCQKQISNGVPTTDVIGPAYPSFVDLRDSSPAANNSTHPVSALLTDILSKFPDIREIPEKVAVHYVMFLIMRWMICPCDPCYERLPEWVRPRKEQLEIPHPLWNDYVPWPIIRLRLITSVEVKFEDFFIPFTSKMCVNWPYPSDQVLIPAPTANDSSAVQMNPVFETHLRDLQNWSVGTVFRTTFPALVDHTVRIQD